MIFLATDDEEGHGETSIRNLIAKYWDKIAAKYAINEGGNVYVKNGKVQYVAVQASEKVSMNVIVTAKGTGGHASIPLKDNAVTHLAAALEKIGNYNAPVHFTTIVRRYFEGIAPLQDDEIGKWIRSLDTPDRGEHASRVISDTNPMWNAMLRDTISPTMLTAGVRANVIPSEAKATLNVRLLPGNTITALLGELNKLVNDPQVKLEVEAERRPGGAGFFARNGFLRCHRQGIGGRIRRSTGFALPIDVGYGFSTTTFAQRAVLRFGAISVDGRRHQEDAWRRRTNSRSGVCQGC